jgi:hypothetical protein
MGHWPRLRAIQDAKNLSQIIAFTGQSMITDVLFKRYPQAWLVGDGVAREYIVLLRQAASILQQDIAPYLSNASRVFEVSYRQLTRELGAGELAEGYNDAERCLRFLHEVYDLWNDFHGSPDGFFKLRLSLIELLFREVETNIRAQVGSGDLKARHALLQTRTTPKRRSFEEQSIEALINGVNELNARFREAKLPFEYHNGIIQIVDDPLTSKEIESPFWSLVSDSKWKNVDNDVKEAVDRRDSGKGDAAFFALKALESAIKIICNSYDLI